MKRTVLEVMCLCGRSRTEVGPLECRCGVLVSGGAAGVQNGCLFRRDDVPLPGGAAGFRVDVPLPGGATYFCFCDDVPLLGGAALTKVLLCTSDDVPVLGGAAAVPGR